MNRAYTRAAVTLCAARGAYRTPIKKLLFMTRRKTRPGAFEKQNVEKNKPAIRACAPPGASR